MLFKRFPFLFSTFLIVFCFFLFLSNGYCSQENLIHSGGLSIAWVDSVDVTVETVASQEFMGSFTQMEDTTITPGSKAATWLRFRVDWEELSGDGKSEDKWLLKFDWPFIHMIELYSQQASGWSVKKAGIIHTWNQPYGLSKHIALELQGKGVSTYYVKIVMQEKIAFSVSLTTLDSLFLSSKYESFWLGIFYGVLLAMLIYNIAMWISLRQKAYLWYVLCGAFLGVYFFGYNGLSYMFWPKIFGPWFYPPLIFGWLATSSIFLVFFAKELLQAKESSRWAERILNGCLLGWIVGLVLAFVNIPALCISYFALMGGLFSLFMFVAVLLCWRQGRKVALMFLIAWGFSCVGGVVLALTISGVLPYSKLGMSALQIGSGVEMVLLSLALAHKVKMLRQQKELFQSDRRKFKELSNTDELTGLSNRRWMLKGLESHIEDSKVSGKIFSLAMLDVDHFKRFNDTFGHSAGDEVLKYLADFINASIRRSDIGCRYGGEEFIILFNGLAVSEAFEVAERLRQTLEEYVFSFGHDEKTTVTMSIGLTEYQVGDDKQVIIDRADAALYKAKDMGRNCVKVH